MNLRWFRAPAGAIVALGLVSCSTGTDRDSKGHGDDQVVHWGYEAGAGPQQWGSMNPEWRLCDAGREQSPIDLANAAPIELPAIELHTPSARLVEALNQEGVIDALDNGHTLQINTKGAERMSIGGEIYDLVQFHFHAPSEHTVDGKRYPVEVHLVHQAADGALAVIGLLMEQGAENRGLAPLWAQLAEASGTRAVVQVPSGFKDDLFSGEGTGVYHYGGSLTTPPCTEGVQWYIRRTPAHISAEQIAQFTAVYDGNNRAVQALNGRTVFLDEDPPLTIY